MSQSLLPKNWPNLFREENLERMQEVLRQPTSIALLVSIGVHGLLAVGLPLLPSNSSEELDRQRMVKVVELTPEEQKRLPTVGSVSPSPLVSPTPGSTKSSPLFPPLTSPSPLPSPSTDLSSLYDIPIPPPLNVPFPISPPPLKNIPFPTFPTEPARPGNREAAAPSPTPSPSVTPSPTPSATTTPGPVAANPSPAPSASPSASPAAPVRPERIPPAAIAALQAQQEKIRQERNLFAFNSANTTLDDYRKNGTAFSTQLSDLSKGNVAKDLDIKPPVLDQYPQEACPFIKSVRNASVGAVVNTEGKIVDKPSLLLSSGYSILDKRALEYVAKREFKTGDTYRGVIYNFVFDPKTACPAPPKPPA